MQPFIAEYAYLPLGMIPGGPDNMRKLLTVTPKKYGQDEVEPIRCYSDAVPGYLGMPIDWAVRRFPQFQWDDRTVLGGVLDAPKRPDPYHPKAAPGQAQFMDDMIKAVGSNLTVFAMADTGTGKTVSTLNTAAHFGRRTLVLCHLDRLCNQWVEEAIAHLGLRPDQIGRVQQDRCEYWKPLCVGTMHSVALRQYPPEFYQAFGFVAWDEVDVCGAPMFAETLGLFPAAYKAAVSATKNRRDGTAKIYLQYFGEPCVVSKAEALPMKAFIIPYEARTPIWGKQHQSVMKCLSLDHERNNLLFDIIMMLNETQRNILVVGERIEHLQHLMERCMEAGIPEDEIGQYTGKVYTGRIVRKEIDGVMVRVKETAEVTRAYLDWAKAHARVFFATYKMIERGIDIPRLDAGVDATPKPDATQIIGRIRRPVPGKPLPVWYTIRDDRSPRLLGYMRSRLKDYQATGVEVEVA